METPQDLIKPVPPSKGGQTTRSPGDVGRGTDSGGDFAEAMRSARDSARADVREAPAPARNARDNTANPAEEANEFRKADEAPRTDAPTSVARPEGGGEATEATALTSTPADAGPQPTAAAGTAAPPTLLAQLQPAGLPADASVTPIPSDAAPALPVAGLPADASVARIPSVAAPPLPVAGLPADTSVARIPSDAAPAEPVAGLPADASGTPIPSDAAPALPVAGLPATAAFVAEAAVPAPATAAPQSPAGTASAPAFVATPEARLVASVDEAIPNQNQLPAVQPAARNEADTAALGPALPISGLRATGALLPEATVPAPVTAAPRSLPNPSPNGMAPVPVALAVDRAIGNALVDRPATGNYKPADLAAQPPLDPARIASTGFVADALQPVATDEPLPALSPLGEPATTPEGGETSAWLTLRPDSLAMALADRTLSRDLAAQVPLEIDQMLRSLDNRLSGMTSAAANLTSVGDMVETLGAAATTGGVQSNPAVPLQAAGQPADLPEPVALSLNAPMQQMGRWANELGDRLAWVANNRFGAATLQVNPPQLGPIEVRILMSGDQATVSFAAVQPQTREAIQQALPVLATSFASQGLSLGQASVGRDHLPQQGGQGGSTGSSGGQSGLTATAVGSVESSAGSNPTRGGNGLVDTFA